MNPKYHEGNSPHTLFEASASVAGEPLAARMRPRTMDEFVGQGHIVDRGRLLRRSIDADQISSLIFYGPPGTGKTTLARVIAGSTQSRFVSLNAVLTGVSDIRQAIADAREAHTLHSKRTILFVDEVHRWNKSQQDALLPWVENGTVILIGATTENPYFEVNKALVSRSRVFQLTSLEDSQLMAIAQMAITDKERGYGRWTVIFEAGALEHLVSVSSGDARSLLNALQLAVETTPEIFPPPDGIQICVTVKAAEESIQRKVVLYDKEGDYHFDTISAFIKSIRGSDPDAALYWMALMIRAGENPRFIFRRMLISACEDVGMAAPEAITIVQSCATAFDRIGLPEGQFHLTHAALYLATAPKSNSSLGYFDALESVGKETNRDVPNHLRDTSRDKHAFGHGEGYKYPHAWREHWIAQQYLPDGLTGRIFYRPGKLGYERGIHDSVMTRREAQVVAMLDEDDGREDILTYSPGDDERERWVRRTDTIKESLALRIRQVIFSKWKAYRHQRVFIPADSGGTLLWEAHRRVPEGGVTALCASKPSYDALTWLAGGLPDAERPHLLLGDMDSPEVLRILTENEVRFDVILARNWLVRFPSDIQHAYLATAFSLMAKGGKLLLAEGIPGGGSCVGELIPHGGRNPLEKEFKETEKIFLAKMASVINSNSIIKLLNETGWHKSHIERCEVQEERHLTAPLLDRWFLPDRKNGYGQHMADALGQETWGEIATGIKALLVGKKIAWRSRFLVIKASRNS